MKKIAEIKKEIKQIEKILENDKINDLTKMLANQHLNVLNWVIS